MANLFLIGKAGSGKDTVASILRGLGYSTYALADPIRSEYKRYFPNGNAKQDRAKMIEIGQMYKVLYGADVWINRTADSIKESDKAVITDGRYAAEYEYFVYKKGYVPVRITCPDTIRLERLKARDGSAQEEALKKESTDLDQVLAFELDNSTTQEHLTERILFMLKRLI